MGNKYLFYFLNFNLLPNIVADSCKKYKTYNHNAFQCVTQATSLFTQNITKMKFRNLCLLCKRYDKSISSLWKYRCASLYENLYLFLWDPTMGEYHSNRCYCTVVPRTKRPDNICLSRRM